MGLSLKEISGGGKSWSPQNVGDKITGKIVSVERKQQTSMDDGSLLTWDDGSPRMMTVVGIQTDLRDDDDDDGVRSLWLKGGKNFEAAEGKGHSGEVALAEAAKKAGSSSVDEGANLTFAMTGVAKAKTRGYQGAKLYTAKYEPPRQTVATDDLFDE